MNAKYNEGRAAIAKADLDLDTATMTLIAVGGAYVFAAGHVYADVSPYVLDTDTSLGGNAVSTSGYFTTAAAVFTGLAVGEDPIAFVLRQASGLLLAFYDTLSDDTPVEGTIIGDGTTVTINAPALGWFRV